METAQRSVLSTAKLPANPSPVSRSMWRLGFGIALLVAVAALQRRFFENLSTTGQKLTASPLDSLDLEYGNVVK